MTETHFQLDDSPWFQMIELDEVTSTNDFLRSYRPVKERRITLVTAEYQSAGRGSGQNHWESERSKNLLFSLLLHPRYIAAEHLFVLSEVLALAIREGLKDFVQGEMGQSEINAQFKIKWPNDIYFGDNKICGMLIENDLKGQQLENCVMGIGINVNQTTFLSDAKNPISLAQIIGHEVERRFVLERVMENFTRYYDWAEQGHSTDIHELYLNNLYRKDEKHLFCDEMGDFYGTIIDVEPTGHLIISDAFCNDKRRYAFKEVEYK